MAASTQTHALLVEQLLGAALGSIVKAQGLVASQLADLVESVGFEESPDGGPMVARTFSFTFTRVTPATDGTDTLVEQDVTVKLPLLSVISLPTIAIDEATVSLDLQIVAYEQQSDAPAKLGAAHAARVATLPSLPSVRSAARPIGLYALPARQRRPAAAGPGTGSGADSAVHVSVTLRRIEAPLGMEQIDSMLSEAVKTTRTTGS